MKPINVLTEKNYLFYEGYGKFAQNWFPNGTSNFNREKSEHEIKFLKSYSEQWKYNEYLAKWLKNVEFT